MVGSFPVVVTTWNTALHRLNDTADWQSSDALDVFIECPYGYFGRVNEVCRTLDCHLLPVCQFSAASAMVD